MVHRISKLLIKFLRRVVTTELKILVHRTRDYAHVQRFGLFRLAKDIECQALVGAIGQPLLKA